MPISMSSSGLLIALPQKWALGDEDGPPLRPFSASSECKMGHALTTADRLPRVTEEENTSFPFPPSADTREGSHWLRDSAFSHLPAGGHAQPVFQRRLVGQQ